MSAVQYTLEVYQPGSTENLWVVFEASQPFGSISQGDIINPGIWPESQSPMKVLRVVGVEHAIWASKGMTKHKIMIYTKELAIEDQSRRLKTLWEIDI